MSLDTVGTWATIVGTLVALGSVAAAVIGKTYSRGVGIGLFSLLPAASLALGLVLSFWPWWYREHVGNVPWTITEFSSGQNMLVYGSAIVGMVAALFYALRRGLTNELWRYILAGLVIVALTTGLAAAVSLTQRPGDVHAEPLDCHDSPVESEVVCVNGTLDGGWTYDTGSSGTFKWGPDEYNPSGGYYSISFDNAEHECMDAHARVSQSGFTPTRKTTWSVEDSTLTDNPETDEDESLVERAFATESEDGHPLIFAAGRYNWTAESVRVDHDDEKSYDRVRIFHVVLDEDVTATTTLLVVVNEADCSKDREAERLALPTELLENIQVTESDTVMSELIRVNGDRKDGEETVEPTFKATDLSVPMGEKVVPLWNGGDFSEYDMELYALVTVGAKRWDWPYRAHINVFDWSEYGDDATLLGKHIGNGWHFVEATKEDPAYYAALFKGPDNELARVSFSLSDYEGVPLGDIPNAEEEQKSIDQLLDGIRMFGEKPVSPSS
ncbi:MAG: hypothetical protein QM621_00505 [Aeromicrobium sp.]|uniref:hypothetical protein n=1 Tax=Aeromicrobium sp. TaxID=1871063 RepID=UPI0039E2BFAD